MKKVLSYLLFFSIISNIVCSPFVYSLWDIPVTSFTISVNSWNAISWDVSVNPGDVTKILISWQNNIWDINNLALEFSFSNTEWFVYDNPNQTSSYIWWSPVNQNISQSTFNPPFLNIAPISSTSSNWDVLDLYYTNLRFLDTAKDYTTSISARFLADWYVWNNLSRNIYVNVKPHIIDYYFEKSDGSQTTSQVQWSDAESINLVLKVKDYNWCNNISSWNVTANLSQLWLSSSESLSYISCEADWKTWVFKKTWITTNVWLWDKTFTSSNFVAVDSDGNTNDSGDVRFWSEDKKTNLNLSVVAASAPQLSILSLDNQKIWWAEKLSYTLSFSWNQLWEYKISLWSDWNCDGWTTLKDWTNYETANSQINEIINSSSLVEWNNSIYGCIKNSWWNIWSININLIKDTVSPTTSNVIISPWSVILNDPSIKFSCNENWQYRVEVWWSWTPLSGTLVKDWTQTTANTEYSTAIWNLLLSLWANTIYAYCRDDATNFSFKTWSVTKVPPTPSMVWTNIVFSDNDVDYNWLDWRDITTSWTLTQEIIDATNFESYRIYILPSNVSFNSTNQNHINILANKNTTSWTWNNSLTKDSLWQNLQNGWSYKICIAIMWTSWQLWTESCSSPSTLTSDIVQNAKILSAKFTTNTNLELTTDATLDTDLNSHSWALISYVYNSTTLNPVSIASVNWSKINLTIPALENLWAVWINIIMLTWAIHSAGWGYNNYNTFASITDWQAPTVTWFANNTSSVYNNFFSWSINIWFTFAEQMKAWWSTKITFDRTAGNISSQKSFSITDPLKLTSWAKTQDLDLVSIWLVSGTTYDMKIVGQDLASNNVTSNAVSLKFDNVWPTAPNLTDAPNTSSQTPTLSWSASIDDSGNGSWVKEYILRIFNSVNCSWTALQTLTSETNSKATNSLNNWTYSWNVYAVDKIWNIWTTSGCDSFIVDTTNPTIDNQKITDINNNNSTSFTKAWNTIEITADLTNTDITKIKADLSALTWNASHTGVLCSSPVSWVSCSYVWGKVTYSFSVWFAWIVQELVRQIKLIVSNISEINVVEKFASITVDNTSPTTWSISSPINKTYGWNSLNIAWSGISDSNLDKINISYSTNGGSSYTSVYTWANISQYNWNIWALITGNNYKIKITAFDKSGNTSITESQIFSLDKSNPTITPWSILYPSSWEYIKWNTTYNITWNAWNITDNETLPTNPITLEYSTNNWTNWSVISSNLPNTGSYTWTVANTSSNQSLIRMKVRDNVGNESTYETTPVFVIDNQNPTLSLTTGTPPNGAYINAWWFEALATAWDNIKIDKIYYSFKRNSNTTYWNGNSYTWVLTWNLLKDNIDSTSYNLNELLSPTIINGENYDFTLKVLDKAWNELSTTPRQYIADTINPILNITNQDNSYFSGSINISGTSSDTWAWVSSVKILIKNEEDKYWNWSAWVVWNVEKLVTNTTNNYANWNYDFTAPWSDSDWQNYEVIVYAYDKSYKENNTSTGSINIILDKTWPVLENDIFTFTPSWFYAGGSSFDITWNPAKITSSWAIYSHVKLEYNDDWVFSVIAWNTQNDWSYSFNLPEIDDSITILISAYDVLGNKSNVIDSLPVFIDSTPPTISLVETMDMSANGQIDALKVTMSESIKDSTINLADFNISGIGTPTSWITWNTANDNIFILKFADFWNTVSTPTLSYTKWSLTDLASKYLETISNISSIDKAIPRILSAEIFANSGWVFNKIEATFSENISYTTDTTAFILNNWLTVSSVSTNLNKATLNLNLWSVWTDAVWYTLLFSSNSNWQDWGWNQAGNLWSAINLIDKAKPILISQTLLDTDNNFEADKVELTFSESLSWSLVWFSVSSWSLLNPNLLANKITFDISWISWTVPDINISYSWSLTDSIWNTLESFSNIQIDEKISPKLETATTLDQNWNGKIDWVLIEFSEDLNGNLADLVVWVNWFTTSWYSMNWNKKVIVSLTEKQIIDTSSKPNLTISSNNVLADNNWNKVLSNQTINSQDGVWPVIIWARFDEGTLDLNLTFSENVSGSLNNSSFVLQNAWASIVSTNFITWEKTAILTLSNDSVTYWVSEISFAWNTAWDNLWNKQNSTYFTKISASVLINEYLSEGSVSYIELKNISSSSVNIWGWIIENALSWTWLVIDNYTLSAWEYYLIATNNTSFSWITANQIASLDMNSNLVLKNWSIIVDSALYQVWSENISFERFENCSDWLNNNCWYKAVVSDWFNNINYFWTPKKANIFDYTPPNLTTNLTWNLLLPLWYYNILYSYSDDILINTWSISFNLQKWNWSNFINTSWYTTGAINTTNANFSLSWLEYWRYKANFSISDSAWNTSNDTKEFYIDNFSFSISTWSLNLWILEPNNLKLANTLIDVEVKTIWAWFEISHNYDINELWDWNGNNWYWACIWNTCTTLENYKNKTFVTQARELQSSWELKTYNYKVKYWSLIDSLKTAWIYQVENEYKIWVNY